ncbi:restriction endonuclease subunit S [Spectribacter hydrogenooxidans]|uniref:Restriction endonuclease subunit S n=1 Tax=Spectribacter hydrogenoxidans TaxID=3075608 RepID=A0ABU3C2L7_9GAMM|nr:restriction endonuclease subunit S [Salinisphaera sp. W335]MDT0635599.1 restriction endonuclease subunit S [Salinisphaera sp. W335]
MSKNDKQHALVPRLRFPEFRKLPGWNESALTGICDVNPSHDGLPESFYYIDLESVEAGTLRNPKRIERANAPSRAQRYLRDGDILYQTVRPYQRNNLLFDFGAEDDYVASTGYAQLRAGESIGFLYQLIHTDSFVERVLAKCTGSNYPAIKSSDLESVSICIPPDAAEQRKIADCLGSLDDWIAAEGRKLEALRDHKKGLMQQLFPREGKTRPRLRFPEFRDAPEWERFLLEQLEDERRIELGRGKVISHDDMRANPGPHPVYSSSVIDNGLMGTYGDYLFDEELISWSVDGGGHFFYRPKHKFSITNVSGFIRVLSDDIICQFLAYQLQRLHASETFNYVQKAHPSVIRTLYTVGLPDSSEQQRIADCLSAIDALITTQAEKINALRIHKRGLMQQLFPSPEDAEV